MFPPSKTVVAWTGGKDSTVLLHLIKNTFNNNIPFPVMFNDSTMEFDEVYEFIQRIAREWRLQLVVIKHDADELASLQQKNGNKGRLVASRMMKIHAINRFQKQHHIRAFISGIRWDEHTARSEETYFSKRKSHVRIHPMLHFTELDIWDYIRKYHVPYVSLYDQGYRSLGEKPFTNKPAPGKGERSGREPDKEQMMEKLRNMGYW